MPCSSGSYITFRKPLYFTLRKKVIYSLLPLLLMFAFFCLGPFARDFARAFPALSFCVFVVLPVAVVCLIPFWNGDLGIRRHFGVSGGGFIVQVRFTPRRIGGFEGWLEDADDVGVLSVVDGQLVFAGDSTEMVIVRDDIDSVSTRNAGVRTLWMCGETRISLAREIEGFIGLEVSSRQALTVPQTRRFNRALEQSIRELVA